MDGNEEATIVLVKNILRSVAMMNVVVNNGNLLNVIWMRLEQVLCSNGDVIEDAESHSLPRTRVMTGRPAIDD